jgi:flavin-dependent dehydrogenase
MVDKSTYPRVKVCGSGISPWALRILQQLELLDQFRPMHAEISGLQAIGPDGAKLDLRGKKGAWVIPRVEFDHGLVQAAVRHGATFREDVKVTGLLRDHRGAVRGAITSQGEIEADMVVAATGSPSRFERDESDRYSIRTIMGWWKATSLPRDQAVMVWDRRLDGYYAWSFPEPDDTVNIGLTIPEGAPDAKRLKELFQDLLDRYFAPQMIGSEQVGKWMGHPATLTTRIGDVGEARMLLVGEAARLVSPASVEGISFAMESGLYAASRIAAAYQPEIGLSQAEILRYRGGLARRMVPKFLAGEAMVRMLRSESVRRFGFRALNSGGLRAFTALIDKLVGA